MSAASRPTVAIVGGGITGACAASALMASCDVTVFDQGRRGAGGRASHRRVRASDGAVLPDDSTLPAEDASTFEFDHGCQFTRADDPAMVALVDEWCARGWVERWAGPFGSVGGEEEEEGVGDFFGLPGSGAPVFVGVGGMQMLPRRVLSDCKARVRGGERVDYVAKRLGDEKLEIFGVAGNAAFHDTSEADASKVASGLLGAFDGVLLTDASSSFSGWHRASAGAGVPYAVAARVRKRVRVPLFSAMVAFDAPLRDAIPFAALTVKTKDSPLWFASRSQSKPGMPAAAAECWVLVSTPKWAVEEIGREPMQDAGGAFKPQTDDYLQSVPGPALLVAFTLAVAPYLEAAGVEMPTARYLQAQRWGSAMPAPANTGGRDSHGYSDATTTEVLGVRYETGMPPLLPVSREAPLVYDRCPSMESAAEAARGFVALDERRIFYAGDFCSRRPPGFEAAALSGLEAAAHISRVLCQEHPAPGQNAATPESSRETDALSTPGLASLT